MEIIHHQFDTLPSTNGYAKKQALSFAKNALTVISTRVQSGGYGQFGRVWHSPPGNIYVSFCLFTKQEIDPFLMTRMMVETLQSFLKKWNVQTTIKWPNDLLVSGKKLMGILTETAPVQDDTFVVIGLGINVNLTKEEAEKIDQPVTSLFLETGQKLDELQILEELIKKNHVIFKNYKY